MMSMDEVMKEFPREDGVYQISQSTNGYGHWKLFLNGKKVKEWSEASLKPNVDPHAERKL